MRLDLSLLTTWNKGIDRLPYLLSGLALMAVKFCVDWILATRLFDLPWSPINYLIWPDERVLKIFEMAGPAENERYFALIMLGISLPFIWVGVKLTHHRLHSAQLPGWLVVLFFLPYVNLLLFLILALVPPRVTLLEELQESVTLLRLRDRHRRITGEGTVASAAIALLVSIPLTVGVVIFGAVVMQSYGWSVFVGSPFFLGMSSVVIFGMSKPQRFGSCMQLALTASLLTGGILLVIAFEGLICLILAAPIAFALTFLGGLVGYYIQCRPWVELESPYLVLGLLILLPTLTAAEASGQAKPSLRAVTTQVILDAPAERVWEYVISFPPLEEPKDLLFRAGVAYPVRAEIHGQGVGAIRHCIFSTGTFVEPIDIWQPPTLLHFQVSEQPEPMRELSPYDIHPPHLHNYLVSERGQFRLEKLEDGRTLLEGTTWYTNRMWPEPYWGVWSDYIIHRIHRRVLEHIREKAEERE